MKYCKIELINSDFMYRICLDMVVNQPFASAHTMETNEFEGGIHFGIGGFNLVSDV